MGKALQVLTGRVTNPSTTLTAVTVNTGDSFTVRSFPFGSKAYILDAWALGATAGAIRIRSPRLHDFAQAIRLRYPASFSNPLAVLLPNQPLYPQDVLTVEQSGGGAETDALSFLVYYEDLPGVDARLVRYADIAGRIRNVVAEEQNVTTGATAGQYSASQALNANFDILKRNVDYAILGAITDTRIVSIGVTGPDTGNLRVGIPGEPSNTDILSGYLRFLSERADKPCIPVINAANVGATTVDVAAIVTSTAINVSIVLAELAPTA